MPLDLGMRIGVYEITGVIGAGGMGEVYRARDTKLDRDVALKILPHLFATDADRLMRFEREAKTLAALNHPQIAQIYGFEQAPAGSALVMELVEGEDLSQRIARGAIAIDDALPIAKQIAEALEAAHEQGIIHRDLKPANVKVRADGAVKVLDFGLAKPLDGSGRSGGSGKNTPLDSPTITSPAMTAAGLILGTAAYMAPEQAKGKLVDRRADIWAFGCVLYEMLTGQRAFRGEDITDTLTAIMRDAPDLTALPATTPPAVRQLIVRCLEKDARQRLPHIGVARLDLDDRTPLGAAATVAPVRSGKRVISAAGIAAALVATALAGYFVATYRQAPAPAPVVKSTIAVPTPDYWFAGESLALSPDGRRIAFPYPDDRGRRMIWVRSLNSLDAQVVPGSENANAPFWSPDSQSLAFSAEGKLKRVDLAGGSVKTITDGAGGQGDWSREDVILFQSASRRRIFRVSAAGGSAQSVPSAAGDSGSQGSASRPTDSVVGAGTTYFPAFLPDGQHFLFLSNRSVYVGALDGVKPQLLLENAGNARYVSGHLLFMRETTLYAQPFDPDRLVLSGAPIAIAESVRINTGSGAGAFSVTANGLLAYVTNDSTPSRLTWFDRTGRAVSTLSDPALFSELSVSADGLWAAASIQATSGDDHDIWLFDLHRGVRTRVTREDADETAPVLSPDGSQVAFSSRRGAVKTLALRAIGSTTVTKTLSEDLYNKYLQDWSADGKQVLFTRFGGPVGFDLWTVSVADDKPPVAAIQTEASENRGALSPDGRFLAYESNESGRAEVYVAAYPMRGATRPVSTAGGFHPRWRRDGKELFFLSGTSMMTAAVTSTGTGIEIGAPSPLFELSGRFSHRGQAALIGGANLFAVAPDGQRFLFAAPQYLAPETITLVVNWAEELTRRD